MRKRRPNARKIVLMQYPIEIWWGETYIQILPAGTSGY
jgi:hypothetical protein